MSIGGAGGQSIGMPDHPTTTSAILAALREGLIGDAVAVELFAAAADGR